MKDEGEGCIRNMFAYEHAGNQREQQIASTQHEHSRKKKRFRSTQLLIIPHANELERTRTCKCGGV